MHPTSALTAAPKTAENRGTGRSLGAAKGSGSHPDEDTPGSNLSARPLLHPGGTTAFRVGEILSGSPLVAFQARRIASPAARLKKIKTDF